jgi:hypothetical protein
MLDSRRQLRGNVVERRQRLPGMVGHFCGAFLTAALKRMRR